MKKIFKRISFLIVMTLVLNILLPNFNIKSFAEEMSNVEETTVDEITVEGTTVEETTMEESSEEEAFEDESETELETPIESEEKEIETTETEIETEESETDGNEIEESEIYESEIEESETEEIETSESESLETETKFNTEEIGSREIVDEETTKREESETATEKSTIIMPTKEKVEETTIEPTAEEETKEEEEHPTKDEYGHRLDENGDIIEPISHNDNTEEYKYPEEPECDEEPELDGLYNNGEAEDLIENIIVESEDVPDEIAGEIEKETESIEIETIESSNEENSSEEESTAEAKTIIDELTSSEIVEEETTDEEVFGESVEISELEIVNNELPSFGITESGTTETGTTETETTESETIESEKTESETLESLVLESTEIPNFTGGYVVLKFYNANGGYVTSHSYGTTSGNYYTQAFPSKSRAGSKTGYTIGSRWIGSNGSKVKFGGNWSLKNKAAGTYTWRPEMTENTYYQTYHLGNDTHEGISYNAGYSAPTSRKFTAKATYPTAGNINSPGWDFCGWYGNESFTGGTSVSIGPNSTASPQLYAKWVPSPGYHEVTFDTDGGSIVKARSILDGNTTSQPADPIKTGRTFMGWYVNDGMGGWAPFNFAMPITNDITVKAFWNVVPPHQVTFHYKVDGVEKFADDYYAVSTDTASLFVREPYTAKVGYDWKGWISNGIVYEGGRNYDFINLLDYDVTFIAEYIPRTYDVNYSIDRYYGVEFFTGGLEATEQRLTNEQTPLYRSNTIDYHDNWKWVGWFDNESCKGNVKTKVDSGTAVDKDFYVKFVPGTGYHLVTFDTRGAGFLPYQSIKDGEKIVMPPDLVKENEDFVAWFYKLDNGQEIKFNENKKIDRDLTLYAKWKKKPEPKKESDGKDKKIEHQEWIEGLVKKESKIKEIKSKEIDGFSKARYDEVEDKFYREKAEDTILNFGAPDEDIYHLKSYVANEWIGVVFNDKTNDKVHWYYIDEKGEYAKQFKIIDGALYYFDDDREMYIGDLVMGTLVYHFSTDEGELGIYKGVDTLYK